MTSTFFVHVSIADGSAYDVGPFDVAGGLRSSDGAIDWVYKQIGLLKSHFPEAILIKHRWNYKETGFTLLADKTTVDIKVEIGGFTFEILPLGREIVPLRQSKTTDVIAELIEPRPITENL